VNCLEITKSLTYLMVRLKIGMRAWHHPGSIIATRRSLTEWDSGEAMDAYKSGYMSALQLRI
jgi:hypothetical protein